MNSQQLLFINFIIFVALVLFFTLGRSKPKQPSRLDLKKTSNDADTPVSEKNEEQRAKEAREVNQQVPKLTVIPKALGGSVGGEKIFFVYNAHEWEAHEVLGLFLNCQLSEATVQYQNLIKTSDPSTFEFYEAAYTALLKNKKT